MKALIISLLAFLTVFGVGVQAQSVVAKPVLSKNDKKIFADFLKRTNRYIARREQLRTKAPPLAKEATPEQIQAFKVALQNTVRADRVNMRQGDVFTQQIAILIRKSIKDEFKGWEASELRKQVLESDTKGVPLKVNVPYPETKELVQMPPTLLLNLPLLHKDLRYRFIGRNLAILDRDSSLIIDFMKDALP
ncbi:MAG: hypothetical protein ABR530_10415 [Pyrinomonadaceae bacterium]